MNISEENIILFDNYLNGKLTKKEVLDFENRMSYDNDFSETFSDYESAKSAVKFLSREKLRSSLSILFTEKTKTADKKEKPSAITELLTEIFNEFFIPFENILTARADSQKDEDLMKAMSHYSKGDYKNASLLFKQLLKKRPTDLVINFYYGISELAQENLEDSKKIFKKIILNDKDLLKELARWYLGLAYLKSGNTKSAMKHFESLSAKSSLWDSEKILQKIKSL